jgi:hypothetical protein
VHSGTKYLTGESNRLSRKEFHELKLAIDRYQQEKFPELVNSLPRHGKSRAASKMHEIERLNTRESEKQELLQTIEENYTKAKSLDEFLSLVAAQGHEPYFRNGRLQGIKFEGNRKFRLNRLGYDKEKLAELGVRTVKEQMELEELRNLRISRSVERDQSSERSIARVEQEIEEKDNERDHEDENGRQSEVDNTDEKEEDTDSENENNNEEGETEDGDESEYGDDDSLP